MSSSLLRFSQWLQLKSLPPQQKPPKPAHPNQSPPQKKQPSSRPPTPIPWPKLCFNLEHGGAREHLISRLNNVKLPFLLAISQRPLPVVRHHSLKNYDRSTTDRRPRGEEPERRQSQEEKEEGFGYHSPRLADGGDGSLPQDAAAAPGDPLTVTETASATATTTSSDWWEKNLEIGAVTVVFAMGILLGLLCLPAEAKHPANVRLTAARLLSMATFLSGMALTMLSFSVLGLRDHLVSSGQRAAARCLRAACPATWVVTLLSLLALIPKKVYLYIALGFGTVIAPAATVARWYLVRHRRAADGGEEEDSKELDAASKITSWVTNSGFAGIIGVIFSVSKIASAKESGAVDAATNAAIFFMLATAILGMFVVTVSKKVAEIRDRRRRRLFVTAVRLANAFLLCALACAGLAASFAVLRCRVFAAFAPLAATSTVSFLLRHCVARRSAGGGGEDDHEARVKAMEDTASKVMAASLAGIMSLLGGWLAEKDHARWGALDTSMVVLTSAFVSSFGFMVLAAAPGSARERLAPVARVLIWSTALLFVATALTVYAVEVSGVKK